MIVTKKEERKTKVPVYKRGFRIVLRTLQFFTPRWKIEGEDVVSQPCLFLARHLNDIGPVILFLQMPVEFRLWVLGSLVKKELNYRHLSEYTFHVKNGLPMWLSRLLAYVISRPASWLYDSMCSIPVFRGSREMMTAIRETIQAMEKGQNVLVLTDVNYTSTEGDVGELYGGFVYIARLFRKKTGKDLSIVPVQIDRRARRLSFAQPLCYHEENGYSAEKERLKGELQRILNLARSSDDPSETNAAGQG